MAGNPLGVFPYISHFCTRLVSPKAEHVLLLGCINVCFAVVWKTFLNSKWVRRHILYCSPPLHSSNHLLPFKHRRKVSNLGSDYLMLHHKGSCHFKQDTGAKRWTITKIGPTRAAPPQKCSFLSLIINEVFSWKHRMTTKETKTLPVHRVQAFSLKHSIQSLRNSWGEDVMKYKRHREEY